VSKWCIFFIF